jgi:hypothetical protein
MDFDTIKIQQSNGEFKECRLNFCKKQYNLNLLNIKLNSYKSLLKTISSIKRAYGKQVKLDVDYNDSLYTLKLNAYDTGILDKTFLCSSSEHKQFSLAQYMCFLKMLGNYNEQSKNYYGEDTLGSKSFRITELVNEPLYYKLMITGGIGNESSEQKTEIEEKDNTN